MDLPLHVKYRPTTLKGVIGQDPTVKSLQTSLKSKSVPHAYLFTGPSGVGKTTLSRILATDLDCSDVIEVDAATNTGIDAMRSLTESLKFCPMSGRNRMVIVDEAHALSKAAFQSLLKIIEEPPPYLFFSFCTTEPEKVPKTIVTRCQSYLLKAVSRPDLTEYLETILDQEEDLADMPLDVLDVAVAHADGGVRQALVNLSMVRGVETAEKAAEVLSSAEQSTAAIDLCRILVSGKGGWSAAKAVIEKMADQNPESIRIVMVNYVSKVLMGSKSESDARRMLAILEEFQGPFNQSEKLGPVLLAVGRLLLA